MTAPVVAPSADKPTVGSTPLGPGRQGMHPAVTTAWSILVFVVFIAGWQALYHFEIIHSIILPPPAEVLAALGELVTGPEFFNHLGITMFEAVAGFILGASAGFAFALADVLSPLARRALRPYIVMLQAMPKIALVPLIITWLGFGPPSKIAQAMVLSFFPVFANTVVGLSVLDDFTVPLMRSLTATKWQILRYLRLPSAMPAFFAGLRTALTFALIGAVVSEMIAARAGLGMMLTRFQAGFDIALMYAAIIVLAFVGVLLFLFIAWVDRKVIFWRKDRSFF